MVGVVSPVLSAFLSVLNAGRKERYPAAKVRRYAPRRCWRIGVLWRPCFRAAWLGLWDQMPLHGVSIILVLLRGIGMSGGGYPPEIDCRPVHIDISRGSIESE